MVSSGQLPELVKRANELDAEIKEPRSHVSRRAFSSLQSHQSPEAVSFGWGTPGGSFEIYIYIHIYIYIYMFCFLRLLISYGGSGWAGSGNQLR